MQDRDARKHAVLVRELSQDEAGWVIYMAKHDAKEDEVQSAWGGKHWSVWNSKLLQKREPLEFTLNHHQHRQLLRVLRNHQRSQRRRDVAKLFAQYQKAAATPFPCEHEADRFEPAGVARWHVFDAIGHYIGEASDCGGKEIAASENAAWLRLKRNSVRPLHGGDLLRLVSGEVVARIVDGIQRGEIFGTRPDVPF